MYINFQQNQVKTQVMIVHTSLSHKIVGFITLQRPTLSDMYHRKTYMHINFQRNRVSRSMKTVRTNLFAKKCKFHKFATTNSNFEKINSLRHASS